ncbi:MAG: response regulator, partial [Rhodobacteraceae bacterium]|nr:response regulator [Paracoccaceae bacterium]
MTERILIVDDIATNRIVLKVKLASAFYDTLQAATGAEAIAIARQARPDLILLEVELPDM